MSLMEIIIAILGALATIAIAVFTFKYVKHQKRIADSMEKQTDIQAAKSKKLDKPIIDPVMQQSQTNGEKGTYHYAVNNLGNEPVKLKFIKTEIWHPDEPERKLSPLVSNVDRFIPKHPGSIELDLVINFSEINQTYPHSQDKSKIQMQPTFVIEDMNSQEFEFKGVQRSIR